MRRQQRTGWRRFLGAGVAVVSIAPLLVSVSGTAGAASSKGCEGGGFRLVNLATGATVAMGGRARGGSHHRGARSWAW